MLGRREDKKNMKRDLEKDISRWLMEEGFRLAKLEKMPGLETIWGFNVFTPPPAEINIKVFQPKQYPTQLVLLMGISFSQPHREALLRLKNDKLIKFMSSLLIELTRICPTCRIGVQPNITDPQAVVVSRVLMANEVSKSKLLDEITRLINCFFVVNALLWKEFPEIPGEVRGKQTPPTVI